LSSQLPIYQIFKRLHKLKSHEHWVPTALLRCIFYYFLPTFCL